jgi:hypothetical protein
MNYNYQSQISAATTPQATISTEGEGKVSSKRQGKENMVSPLIIDKCLTSHFSESEEEEDDLAMFGSGGDSDQEPIEAEEAAASNYRSTAANNNENINQYHSTSALSTIHNPTTAPGSAVTTATSTGAESGLITAHLQQSRRTSQEGTGTGRGNELRRSGRIQGDAALIPTSLYLPARRRGSNPTVPMDPPSFSTGTMASEDEHNSSVSFSSSGALSALATDGTEKAADSLEESHPLGHDVRGSALDEKKSEASQDAQGALQAPEFSQPIGLRTPRGAQLDSASLPTLGSSVSPPVDGLSSSSQRAMVEQVSIIKGLCNSAHFSLEADLSDHSPSTPSKYLVKMVPTDDQRSRGLEFTPPASNQ